MQKKMRGLGDLVKEYGGSISMWRSRLIKREIDHVKLGRKYFVFQDDLDRFFEQRKVRANNA